MQLTKPNFRTCLEALRPSTLLKPWKETRNTIIIDKHSDKIKTENTFIFTNDVVQ